MRCAALFLRTFSGNVYNKAYGPIFIRVKTRTDMRMSGLNGRSFWIVSARSQL